MSVYTAIRPPGGASALIAAAADRKHRPASHPLLSGRITPLPSGWDVTHA